MMRVFIPSDIYFSIPDRELFILTRPFKIATGWGNDFSVLSRWDLANANFLYEDDPAKASVMLLPYSINLYYSSGNKNRLKVYDELCKRYSLLGYAFISGDRGIEYSSLRNIVFFRMGGFQRQLNSNNRGFPVFLSDQLFSIYGKEQPEIREKKDLPIIGFCGHASSSELKRLKELLKLTWINLQRAIKNPMRRDWEPFFPSVWYRAFLLKQLQGSALVKTNFILRDRYRAGATTKEDMQATTLEYYHNIKESDYVLCVRGGGNFSVRLYETLMMGRIPVFINTDCLLPFFDAINWREHVVWINWEDREHIPKLIYEFHSKLSSSDFRNLQLSNRNLWKDRLSVKGVFFMLKDELSRVGKV
ncbi:MAG: exostosin family protein [Cyclobacteriaceae bacterium]|nr:exostosin family protein [Cyclobacteriaceae bacterium]